MRAGAANKMDLARREMVARVYVVRGHVASRLTMGLRVLTLGAVAVAFFFLVENKLIIGLIILLLSGMVTWLVGLWTVPWGRDAYLRKLSRIMRDLIVDLRYADQPGASQGSIRRCIHRMQRLKPPAVWAVDHREHLEALAAYGAALQRYQDVVRGADADTVERAAAKLAEAHSVLNTRSQELSAKIGQAWINPTMLSASQGSEMESLT